MATKIESGFENFDVFKSARIDSTYPNLFQKYCHKIYSTKYFDFFARDLIKCIRYAFACTFTNYYSREHSCFSFDKQANLANSRHAQSRCTRNFVCIL